MYFPQPAVSVAAAAAAAAATVHGSRRAPERHGLALDFYAKTCPAVDQIVANVTAARYRDFPAAGPAVLRLFHHDCFVEVRNNRSMRSYSTTPEFSYKQELNNWL